MVRMSDKYLKALMYDFYNQHTLRGQNDDIAYYIKQIKKYHSKKILVVGAGTGRVAIPLSEIAEVVALDFDQERLTILNEKNNKIRTICVDFIDYITQEKYDMIILPYSTLQFSSNKEKLEKMIRKMFEIMSMDTVTIFDVSAGFNTKEPKIREMLFSDYCDEVNDQIEVYYTANRYDKYINFIVEYYFKNINKRLIENENYYYYDGELIKEILNKCNLELIMEDIGYNEDSFQHKHLYHCRRKK